MKISHLPNVIMRSGESFLQLIQDEIPGIATPRSPNLPELLNRHSFKIGAGGSKLGPMKQRLPARKLGQNFRNFWIGHIS